MNADRILFQWLLPRIVFGIGFAIGTAAMVMVDGLGFGKPTNIPERERLVWEDEEVRASLDRGMDDAANGRTQRRDDFWADFVTDDSLPSCAVCGTLIKDSSPSPDFCHEECQRTWHERDNAK